MSVAKRVIELGQPELIRSVGESPTPLPGSMVDWLHTFAEPFANALREDHRKAFFDEVQQILHPRLCGPDGRWIVDYVRLRFAALRQASP